MFKIKIKERQEDDSFKETILKNTYHFEKLATNAMLVLGRERQKALQKAYKGKIAKKEAIIMFFDKKTPSVGLLKTMRKKPEEVLVVYELVKED